MLPYLPPLPPLASIARLAAGTVIAAGGIALACAPAPYHVGWLPVLLVGCWLSIPVIIGGAE